MGLPWVCPVSFLSGILGVLLSKMLKNENEHKKLQGCYWEAVFVHLCSTSLYIHSLTEKQRLVLAGTHSIQQAMRREACSTQLPAREMCAFVSVQDRVNLIVSWAGLRVCRRKT